MKDYLCFNGFAVETLRGDPPATAAARFLTADGKCVYGTGTSAPNAVQKRMIEGLKLLPYDAGVERQRRLVCDSALGQLALDNPGAVLEAVRMVNMGIRAFVHTLHKGENFNLAFGTTTVGQQAVAADGKYVSNATSFGRLEKARVEQLSDAAKRRVPREADQKARVLRGQMNEWLAAFNEPDLARQIGLHDLFLKVHCTFESAKNPGKKPITPKELAATMGLREEWYDGPERGRMDNPDLKKPFSSSEPGLIGPTVTIAWQDILKRCGVNFATMRQEARERAVDKNVRDVARMRREYGAILDANNLLFVASASGTTSTLFTSAFTFAPTLRGNLEQQKKYLLACVAYLVGGGMHSCDEVFFTGGKAGMAYTPGKYLDMLPSSFLKSEVGQKWKDEFWEIVRPDRRSPR
jgi:hypothetical protein